MAELQYENGDDWEYCVQKGFGIHAKIKNKYKLVNKWCSKYDYKLLKMKKKDQFQMSHGKKYIVLMKGIIKINDGIIKATQLIKYENNLKIKALTDCSLLI